MSPETSILVKFLGPAFIVFMAGWVLITIGNYIHWRCRRRAAVQIPTLDVRRRFGRFLRVEMAGDWQQSEQFMDPRTLARANLAKRIAVFGFKLSIAAGLSAAALLIIATLMQPAQV